MCAVGRQTFHLGSETSLRGVSASGRGVGRRGLTLLWVKIIS